MDIISTWLKGNGKGKLMHYDVKGEMITERQNFDSIDDYLVQCAKYVGNKYEFRISASPTLLKLEYRRLPKSEGL